MPDGARPLARLEFYDELERELDVKLRESPDQWRADVRAQAEADLYFYARYVSTSGSIPAPLGEGRAICHPFIYQGYRAVQHKPWGVMDLWARGHWKTTTKSKDLFLWELIRHQGTLCQAVISITRDAAKAKVRRLMAEIEGNALLPEIWPDIFAKNSKDYWPYSPDLGINLLPGMKNPRDEAQIEAWGLDVKPGKHFDRLYFDDVSDEASVNTPGLIAQARQFYDLWGGSENESAPGGPQRTHHGTPYSAKDLNVQIVTEGLAALRCRPAVDPSDQNPRWKDIGGKPLYLSEDRLRQKKAEMRDNYGSQYLMDPDKGRQSKLSKSDLRYYPLRDRERIARSGSKYIVVDPNGWATLGNDYCAIIAVALGSDKNVYILDIYLGNPNPGERVDKIIEFHRRWHRPVATLIEEVNSQGDSYWLKERQSANNYRFEVTPVQVPRNIAMGSGAKRGLKKAERIANAVQPLLNDKRLFICEELTGELGGQQADLVRHFELEIEQFPFTRDCNSLAALALMFAQGDHLRAAPDLIWPTRLSWGLGVDYDDLGNSLRPGRAGPAIPKISPYSTSMSSRGVVN